MSQISHVFGYIFVGGSPSEVSRIADSLAFNKHVISSLDDPPWHSDDFRFSESDDVRASQTIAVAKFVSRGEPLQLMDTFLQILRRMHISDGYVINRSIDRAMRGLPQCYEYDLDVHDYTVGNIQPVGDSLTFTRTET